MHFADGEFAVSYEESIRGAHVFLVQSTFPNSDNLMELLLMIDAAKRASAKSRGSLILKIHEWGARGILRPKAMEFEGRAVTR